MGRRPPRRRSKTRWRSTPRSARSRFTSRRSCPGHVANRLQSALYREVVYLIGQGVLDVADADDAVSWGPGLRWGVMGPNLLWHLGGGQGGIQHFMDTLMPRMAAGWPGLGNPEFTPELQQQIVNGRPRGGGRPVDRRARRPSATRCCSA